MEKKLTAVEWLVDKVFCKRTCKWKGVIEQAKEMEKEQTENLYTEEQVKLAYMQGYNRGIQGNPNDMENYINFIRKNNNL
jgi:hypothetical protein